MQKLVPLINISEHVYGITSAPVTKYQGAADLTDIACTIRTLHNAHKPEINYPILPVPNMVTGITANLLSYCVHTNRECQIFVGFFDAAPVDSINSRPFLELFKKMGVQSDKTFLLTMQAPSNNLYM